MKKLHPILKSVVVLSCISVICVSLLAVANKFLWVSPEERLTRALTKIMTADSFDIIYDMNSDEMDKFNDVYGVAGQNYVSGVYRAVGGTHAGKYLIESTGSGNDNSPVTVLTAYNLDGSVMKTVVKEYGAGNTWANKVNIDKINSSIKDKKGNVMEYDKVVTGVTYTVRGIMEAVTIANTFYDVKLGAPSVIVAEKVTDTLLLAQLDTLFSVTGSKYKGAVIDEYYSYPISPPQRTQTPNVGRGAISTAYKAFGADGQEYVIARIAGQPDESYGNWTLLVLMDNVDNTIAAVNPIESGMVYGEDNGTIYDAAALKDALLLTSIFREVKSAGNSLLTSDTPLEASTTSATQSNKGLKAAIIAYFDKIGAVLEIMETVQLTREGL